MYILLLLSLVYQKGRFILSLSRIYIYIHIYIYTHTYIYIYIYIYICYDGFTLYSDFETWGYEGYLFLMTTITMTTITMTTMVSATPTQPSGTVFLI